MGFELSEKRAEIPSASSLGPTFGPLRALGVEPQQVVLGEAEAADGCVGF